MNLDKLFETQKILDDRIVEEKGLQGVDLLDKKILALQVELGELANEWQLFKFWKDNPEPRTFKREKCPDCFEKGYYRGNPPSDEKRGVHGLGNHWYFCERCAGFLVIDRNPLLEEYVDVLHFILSIGNDLGATYKIDSIKEYEEWSTTQLFNAMYYQIAALESETHRFSTQERQQLGYDLVFNVFTSIGKRLNFTWKQIEQAYYQKNEINHERQDNGY